MGFHSVKDITDAHDAGRSWMSFIHKTSCTSTNGSGVWGDASMGAGTPKFNAYVGTQYEASALSNNGNTGIYLGPDPAAGQTKHLHSVQLVSTSAGNPPALYVLCDYLLFYPLIDGDNDLLQEMVNDTASLPRYTDGEGVQMMMVCTIPSATIVTGSIGYTNSAGVAGRSTAFSVQAGLNVGMICCSSSSAGVAAARSPFIPLQKGDFGIRSVQDITFAAGVPGGFFAIVLVKPLAHIQIREQNVPAEVYWLQHRGCMPRIYDGAYLNFIFQAAASGSPAVLRGHLEFVWG